MYIDIHTKDSMIKSACKVLNISKSELQEYLYRMNEEDDIYYEMMKNFIDNKMVDSFPDEILFFHFARRFNGTENAFSYILKGEGWNSREEINI